MAIKEDYGEFNHEGLYEDENDTSLINNNIYQIFEFYGTTEPLIILQQKFINLNLIIQQSNYNIDMELVKNLEKGFLAFYSYLLNKEKYISIPAISPLEDDSIDFRWKTDQYDILLNIDDEGSFTMDTDIFPGYYESLVMPLQSLFERLDFNVQNIDTSIDKTVTRLID